MTKDQYKILLQSSKWKSKRALILKRDGYRCVKCGNPNYLQVHHTYYLLGNKPWQYPNDCLLTLCNDCHEAEHSGKDITSFIKKKKTKKVNNNKSGYKIVKSRKQPKRLKTKKKRQRKNEALKQENERLRNRQNPNIKYNFSI